ncbi:Peroxisome biogenesis factor 10 [Quillaja saponaria]|uniref:RING-type E3 ubiquitin transferase n=1 Tax=Quillaja saponaria TaxID=32244 RepID=A0AAD7LI69_QUISA|nr:Peroxisome biogenesis factor 10 [Quillaja saponaria]
MGLGHLRMDGQLGSGELSTRWDAGPSTSPDTEPAVPRRQLSPAAQPEIMRTTEKDDQYASYVYEACRDAFRHLFGTRVSVAYQSETKLLGQMLYYVLTTGSGQQMLGEEYCDITQFRDHMDFLLHQMRRALFIIYRTAVPYVAEGISSRIASHGIVLADSQSDEFYGENAPWSSHFQSYVANELPSSSTSGASVSAMTSLKDNLVYCGCTWFKDGLQLFVLPIAHEFLQLVLRANLMFFYFEGLYYHISKRSSGIYYVFTGKPSNQTPRYQILGIFLLIQLCILAVEGLRQSNVSSIASSVHQASFGAHQATTGQGLPILNEEGTLAAADTDKGSWICSSFPPESQAANGTSKCTLCLSNCQNPTATSCGHVTCITEWCNEKPECPLCRTPITHSSLVCLYHSDF